MNTQFDNLIKDKLDSGEFQYNPANWHKLREKLISQDVTIKAKSSSLLLLLSAKKLYAAASIFLVVSLSTWILLKRIDTPSTQLNANTNIVQPNATKSSSPKAIVKTSTPSTPKHNATIQQSIQHQAAVSFCPTKKSIHQKWKAVEMKIPPAISHINFHEDTIIQQEVAKEQNRQIQPNLPIQSSEPNTNKQDFIFSPYHSIKERNGHATFGLVGGVGIGDKNSSYSAGISYTSKLSNALFIDAAICFSSSNVSSVASLNNATLSGFSDQFSTSNGVVPVKYAEDEATPIRRTQFLYVAINPSLGLKLSSLLSVKAGFDIQQRISNSNYSSFVETSNGLKPLPTTDFGLTPKVGIRLNSHWNTYLMYRKGVNQWISQKYYFERDYMQIQLGYNF